LRKAPSGQHYTDALKASVLAQLEKAKDSKVANPQVAAEVVKSISALELDWRVPKLSPAAVKPGTYSAVDFQGVAWVGMRNTAKPGNVTLRIEAGLPAPAAGFGPTWPQATYAFDFTGELAKKGYVDVHIHAGGLRFEAARLGLRILEWDGKAYKDITTHVDSSRGTITGRTTSLTTRFVLVTR
jgi:hypothetical protein